MAFLPVVVPADSFTPGANLAQDTRCPAVGKRCIWIPVSARITCAATGRCRIDWQYVERVEAWNAERIAEVRSAGRRAGRWLGYNIATFQSDAEG
ncbi:hypothetical protein [Micromonospora sp. NPDC051006]|uniref:hypothetical protein n=1 Tax=Micromonospora sp. NPDC051006 TaxID=3364283 RepID=UPI0037AEF7CF